MAKIAIIGTGRIGTAAAKLLLNLTDHELALIDADYESLEACLVACEKLERPAHRVAFSPALPIEATVADGEAEIRETLLAQKPDLILCSVPYGHAAVAAKLALELNLHYVDFTEDIEFASDLAPPETYTKTLVPQTGVAPGLINYLGLSLFDELDEPKSLKLRVGALPIVAFGPAGYAETWNLDGVVAEYLSLVTQREAGQNVLVQPLAEYENLVVNGVSYEAFTTAGGTGLLEAYEHIPNVTYKTLRYPGHRGWILSILNSCKPEDDAAEVLYDALSQLDRTRDDMVAVVAHASDVTGDSATASMHFYPNRELDLSAIELTTAGTGVAIIELILNGELKQGLVTAKDVPFDKLMATSAMQIVFDSAD